MKNNKDKNEEDQAINNDGDTQIKEGTQIVSPRQAVATVDNVNDKDVPDKPENSSEKESSDVQNDNNKQSPKSNSPTSQ